MPKDKHRQQATPEMHTHGPQNAEHELRKAYNTLIEAELVYSERKGIPGTHPQELADTYRHAYQCYRNGDRLAAERWARTVKHLARALWHEAKVDFLKPRLSLFPYLEGALPEEYNLYEREDTTVDLLNSLEHHIPPGLKQMPERMTAFLSKGRKHLELLTHPSMKNELLRAEHIKAAHEYGRVVECMALAYEAEAQQHKAA